jgi:hypothetical protein
MFPLLSSPARRAVILSASTACSLPPEVAEAAADALLDPTPAPHADSINAELRGWHRCAAGYVPAGVVLRAARSLPVPMTEAVPLVLELVFRCVLPPPGAPADQRREFIQSAISCGITSAELAYALGVTGAAVRMAVHRAKRPAKPKRETFADRQKALYVQFPDVHHLVLDEIAAAAIKLHRPRKPAVKATSK